MLLKIIFLQKDKKMNSYSKQPLPMEKIISGATYLTGGAVGFIWIILAFITKRRLTPFLMFNIYQSFFLFVGFFLVSKLLEVVLHILSFIPFVNILVSTLTYYFTVPLFGMGIIDFLILVVIVYLSLFAFMGKYSYLPWVSD